MKFLLIALLFSPTLRANPTLAEHEQSIRSVTQGVIDAIHARDLEKMLSFLDEKMVLISINGDITESRIGVRGYFEKMLTAPIPILRSARFDLVGTPTIQFADATHPLAAVTYGKMLNQYVFFNGRHLDIPTTWAASVQFRDGTWKVESFQLTADPFGEAFRGLPQWLVIGSSVGMLFVGLIMGLLVAYAIRKIKQAQSQIPAPRTH